MIQCLLFHKGKTRIIDENSADFIEVIQNHKGKFWIDMVNEPAEKCEPVLKELFKFSPLALDDTYEQNHFPKIDDWEDYIFMVLHSVIPHDSPEKDFHTLELDIFLGKKYLVTHHNDPIPGLDRVWNRLIQTDISASLHTPVNILYRIGDEITDDFMTLIDELDINSDELQEKILKNNRDNSIPSYIFDHKNKLMTLKRILAPQREVFDKLSSGLYPLIANKDRMLFKDIYDHYFRLFGMIETLREMVGNIYDIYLAEINNRMNSIIKVLTIITTILMPVSFITSFFGMNFFNAREPLYAFTEPWVLFLAILLMLLAPGIMLYWMKRNRWL